ncbi:MAG: class I SAM-dependent methyltransferase [Pirellulales bacterium]
MESEPRSLQKEHASGDVLFWDRRAASAQLSGHRSATLLASDRLSDLRVRVEEALMDSTTVGEAPQRVLDLGCGTGRWAVYFARRGAQVVACDYSSQMVERAREAARDAQLEKSITLRVDDLLGGVVGSAAEGVFDLVHVGGVLQYVSDAVLADFILSLQASHVRDARVLIRVPVARRPVVSRSEPLAYYRTRGFYVRLWEQHGWRLERETASFPMPAFLHRFSRMLPQSDERLLKWLQFDYRVMRTWPVPLLLRVYSAVTRRGCGENLEQMLFSFQRSAAD